MSGLLERLWYPPAEGEGEGAGTRLLRASLHLLSFGFRGGVAVKNALYDAGHLQPFRVEGARVLSVGNLNVGGAGKTQVVIFLAEGLLARGEKVAVLSRGYGRASKEVMGFDASCAPPPREAGDEPVLIALRCPKARVWVGADRRALAKRAVAEGATVLVLDDGMQHRRLARDEEIVVLNEAMGLGNGALWPAGPLREPPSALRRASLLWLRAAEGPSRAPPVEGPVVRARHAPTQIVGPDGAVHPPDVLRGRRVHLLSALARPGAFLQTARALGAEVAAETVRPDHHACRPEEVQAAQPEAQAQDALLLTTEKDRVKLPNDAQAWVVRLGVEILEGKAHLERVLG